MWESYEKCCKAVKADSECGRNWIHHPILGRCYCEKKGFDCEREGGTYNEYRLPEVETTPTTDTGIKY